MKIDWLKYEDKQHVLAWVVLEGMSAIGIENFGDFDSSSLDVELRVNGIEVPFEKTMNFLNSQLDEIKAEGVEEGRQDERRNVHDKLGELLGMWE